jgi:hypothetical protein
MLGFCSIFFFNFCGTLPRDPPSLKTSEIIFVKSALCYLTPNSILYFRFICWAPTILSLRNLKHNGSSKKLYKREWGHYLFHPETQITSNSESIPILLSSWRNPCDSIHFNGYGLLTLGRKSWRSTWEESLSSRITKLQIHTLSVGILKICGTSGNFFSAKHILNKHI